MKEYKFKSMNDVNDLIELIINTYDGLEDARLGLSELCYNAVEHGNLGITFDEKTVLLKDGTILEDIDRRLALDENKHKFASLTVIEYVDDIIILIADQGGGFDWKKYLDKSIIDVTGNHGRGILMSEMMLDSVTYLGNGNKVAVVVRKENEK